MKRKKNKFVCAGLEKGFTIMELVIVLLVTGIILASVAPVFNAQTRAYIQVRDGKDLLQSSRIALHLMANELAGIQNSADLQSGSSNSIRFDTTVQGQAFTDITYQINDEIMLRSVGLNWLGQPLNPQPLIYAVKQLTIDYFNDQGVQIGPNVNSASDVYRIRITLTTGNDDHELTLTRDVVPRNFFSMQ